LNEEEMKYCSDCGTEQLCKKTRDGWKCSVCGAEFTEDESQTEADTMNEEEEFF
jgi:ribosomal protein L37AE/L43A